MRNILKISVLSVVALTSCLPAMAQEGGERPGARFKFAPNIYRVEQPRVPKDYYPAPAAHNVKAGAVPSKNVLGIDPSLLTKPQPAIAAPAPAPVLATTPQMMVPMTQPKATFNPMFGKPQAATAALPAPKAESMPAPAVAQAPAAKAPSRAVATNVAGVLKSRRRPAPASMQGTPAVATYGNGMGYQPGGSWVPTQAAGSTTTQTDVRGTIIKRK